MAAQSTESKSEYPSQAREMSNGAIVILSGGPFDLMNPPEVRRRMDQIITDLNTDPWVLANTQGKGLIYHLFPDQQTPHIHQTKWKEVSQSPLILNASPLILIGHSNGGAAVMNVARALQAQGRTVDLLITCDSVLTLDDNGNPYEVPPNVQVNLNSYSIPVYPIWWTAPFPFGKKNYRKADGSLSGLVNIGLPFPEPGALEHRDVFYDVAGGDPKGTEYQYPELIRDAALAILQGTSASDLFAMTERYLQLLADRRSISIYLNGDGITATLGPGGHTARVTISSDGSDAEVSSLHAQMTAVEQIRLSVPASPG